MTVSVLEKPRNKVGQKVQSSAQEPWRSGKNTGKNLNAVTHSQTVFSIVTVGCSLPPKKSQICAIICAWNWTLSLCQSTVLCQVIFCIAWISHVRFIPNLQSPVLPQQVFPNTGHKPPFLWNKTQSGVMQSPQYFCQRPGKTQIIKWSKLQISNWWRVK